MRVPAIATALLFGAAVAQAQLLDLGSAQPPAPGTGAAALGLGAQLRDEASRLGMDIRSRARAAVRQAGAALLEAGEASGATGSTTVVLGRTIAARLPTLDALLTDAATPEPVLHLLVHDLTSGIERAKAPTPEPERYVRDALAELARTTGAPTGGFGWVERHSRAAPPGLPIDQWGAAGLGAEGAAALRRYAALLEAGEQWPSMRRASGHAWRVVAEAGEVLDTSVEWIDASARMALAGQFEQAALGLTSSEEHDAALQEMRRLARLARLIRATDAMELAGQGASLLTRRAQGALVAAIGTPAGDLQGAIRTLDAYERILGLVRARGDLPDDLNLVRQVRPAYRTLWNESRQTELALAQAMPDVLRRPEAMTEPGMLAAIAAHQRAIDDLRALAALSAVLAQPDAEAGREPPVAREWERIASRVLELGQDVMRRDRRAAALPVLRQFAEQAPRFLALAGEADLGGNDPAWGAVTGGRPADLAQQIAERRRLWLSAWERGHADSMQLEGERLVMLAALMETLADAAVVETVTAAGDGAPEPRYAALQAWPGWQLPASTLGTLARGLTARAGTATALAIDGDPAEALKAVQKLRGDYAGALLAGRLTVLCEPIGLAAFGAAAAVNEVGAGSPIEGESWLGAHRQALADVCRYAEELPAADRMGARDRASQLRGFVNAQALLVLDALRGGAGLR